MRLSTRSRYGLRAMVSIARRPQNPVSSQTLAACEDVSKKYLDRLLNKLRCAGLLKSVKGLGGGYILARPAEDIRVGDIVYTLEDGVCLVPCVDDPTACTKAGRCPTQEVWRAVSTVMKESLNGFTLADLVDWKPGRESLSPTFLE